MSDKKLTGSDGVEPKATVAKPKSSWGTRLLTYCSVGFASIIAGLLISPVHDGMKAPFAGLPLSVILALAVIGIALSEVIRRIRSGSSVSASWIAKAVFWCVVAELIIQYYQRELNIIGYRMRRLPVLFEELFDRFW